MLRCGLRAVARGERPRPRSPRLARRRPASARAPRAVLGWLGLLAGVVLACSPGPATDADGAADAAPTASVDTSNERGPVRVTVRATPAEPRIGDILVLSIEVRAERGVEVLMPEFGEVLDRFRILDFAPSESLDADGQSVFSQRYRLALDRSGTQRVPPIAVEFVDRRPGQRESPEGADAYELLTDPLELEVASLLPADAELELRPARGELPPLRSPVPWVVGALLALAAGGIAAPFVWRAILAARARLEQRSAYDVARAELDALLAAGLPDAGSMDPFFVALSRIVRRYLEARFAFRAPELTTEEFLVVMAASPDLSSSHQAMLQGFLRQADLVKFAHLVPSEDDVRASVESAERFLYETRDRADETEGERGVHGGPGAGEGTHSDRDRGAGIGDPSAARAPDEVPSHG